MLPIAPPQQASIRSYLAFAKPGQRDLLAAALARLPHCETLPADNREVVVLITDTPDEAAESALQDQLAQVEALQFLSLVTAVQFEEAA